MKTVLVADDELSIQKLYQRELTREGYNVVCASNAQEAIQKTQLSHPDLVIMDIRMPGMDGIEAMGRILEEDNEIPVVINTAYSSYKDSFLSWSADAYITKSSDLTELKATIHDILSKGEGSPQAEGKEPANEAPAAEHAAQ
jgi:CheY-like chemotaxis protein